MHARGRARAHLPQGRTHSRSFHSLISQESWLGPVDNQVERHLLPRAVGPRPHALRRGRMEAGRAQQPGAARLARHAVPSLWSHGEARPPAAAGARARERMRAARRARRPGPGGAAPTSASRAAPR